MRIVRLAASRWSANKPFLRLSASCGTPYRRESEGMVSWDGSRKCKTSSAGGSVVSFSLGGRSGFRVEYGGGWLSSDDRARVV